jgi:hypothetical protein
MARFPGEAAEIDGYIVAPDQSVTIAATSETPGGLDMIDTVWVELQRRGLGRRRMILLDDRGRTVSVLTLAPPHPTESLELLRSHLLVPIVARDGVAEVHLLATPDEVAELEGKFPAREEPPPPGVRSGKSGEAGDGRLDPEDWAFLGLLCSVGAFDGPSGPSARLLAELFGLEPRAFVRRATAVQQGLASMVRDLFDTSKAPVSGAAA